MNSTIDLAPRRRTAMTTSIVVHALLVFLLMWLTIQVPDPPLPAGGGTGMELGLADLGLSDIGMGETEETDGGPTEAPEESVPEESNEGDVIAEDDGEKINMPVKDPDRPASDKPAVKPTNKPPKISEPTVSKGFQNAMDALKNKGNKGGQGVQGTPNGTLNGGGGDSGGGGGQGGGTGGGNGPGPSLIGPVGIELAGRSLRRNPDLSQKPTESGKVVLNIFVDPSGKVIRTTRNMQKSKTTSSALFELANRIAMTAAFTAKPEAQREQQGEMTFNFELK